MDSLATHRDDVPRTRRARLQEIFRDESNGGITVMVAALIAIVWANSAWADLYFRFTTLEIGSAGFSLSVAHWTSELLLAVFFFVVGIELKHEMSFGSLSSFRKALVPTSAALGGMFVAGLAFYLLNAGTPYQDAWAIPVSTDIAFALALLAVVGKSLPQILRVFLLTLAVVNDLAAIVLIAVFYGGAINAQYLALSATAIAVFAWIQRTRVTSLAIYIPLAAVAWFAMHHSGVHATVAGVCLGLAMRNSKHDDETSAPADHAEHVLRPFSAGFCVPMFALVTAGISMSGLELGEVLSSRLTLGIILGLIVGQPIGVLIATRLATWMARAPLPSGLSWLDIWVVGSLAGIGFTVALLVSNVSFDQAPAELATAKFAILLTNICALVIATLVIKIRAKSLGK